MEIFTFFSFLFQLYFPSHNDFVLKDISIYILQGFFWDSKIYIPILLTQSYNLKNSNWKTSTMATTTPEITVLGV